jgi:hypothetical protein
MLIIDEGNVTIKKLLNKWCKTIRELKVLFTT